MSAKIINSHRYKKTTRKKAENKKEQKYRYLNNKKKNELRYIKQKQKKEKKSKLLNDKSDRISKTKSEVDNLLNLDKSNGKKANIHILEVPIFFKIAGLIFCIILISFISKEIVNIENSPIIKVFSNKDEEKNLQANYELKIGIANLDTTNILQSKNIILKELEKLSYPRLIKVNNDYTITYLGAQTVDKVTNKEYNVLLNDKYKISIDDFKNAINLIKNTGSDSIYYKYLSNIESIEEISKKQFKIKLYNDNPYFLYALDFPISSENGKGYYKIDTVSDTTVSFLREDSKLSLNSITLSNYADPDKMVEDFRNNNIDVFFASSNNAMQLIGKHEYNLKKYRNGETIFLLGNKDSNLFSRKEIRQSIMYSLNREEIVKDVNSNYGEIVDLPFIYSDIKYKYDIYGAQNILLTNSWKKNESGIFEKEIDGGIIRAELNLIVNSEDLDKVKIAGKIKEMCERTGIIININEISSAEILDRISNKNYDLVLADVFVNDYPDVTYLQEYINLNENIDAAFAQIRNSSLESLPENINNLQNVLSSEVACIGIFARNINVVYQKDITGFDSVKYFKVFENIENIGRVNDEIGGE